MRTSKASEVFNLLKGNWNFTRTIPGAGVAKGRANFIASNMDNDSSLIYREEGKFEYGGSTVPVYREYMYQLAGVDLSVYFFNNGKQGDLFHTLKFDEDKESSEIWQATAFHPCGQDTYDTKYIFYTNDKEFEIQHVVKGPNKDYVSKTTFERSF